MSTEESELCLYDPVACGGHALHFNWFGADHVRQLGYNTNGNNDTNRNKDVAAFAHISDDDWHPNNTRPRYFLGQQDNNHASKDIWYVSAAPNGSKVQSNCKAPYNRQSDINYLFQEGGQDRRGFISDWNGHFSSGKKWYQSNGFAVCNNSDTAYPFAVKGLAFTIAVPDEENSGQKDAWGYKTQYGQHCQINFMHGLWIDKDGKYHSYELLPNGDNHGKAKVSDLRDPYWNTDPDTTNYYFLRDNNRGTSAFLKDYYPKQGQAAMIRVMTTDRAVEHMWFKGFCVSIGVDKSGTENKAHTIQWSNLAPIPYHSPRGPAEFFHKAVLGAPTSLSNLKKGRYQVKKWGGMKTRDNYDYSDLDYFPGFMGDRGEPPQFKEDGI